MPTRKELIDRMDHLGVSKTDLAREMGVARSTVWLWLRDEPSARQARIITEKLNEISARAKVVAD